MLVNPITYGGGGVAQIIRLLTVTLKRLYLAPPNLVTFVFIYYTHFGRILAKSIHQGGCCSSFWSEMSRKIKPMKFLFCLKTMEMQWGEGVGTLCQKRCLNPISTGLFCLVVALGGCFPPPFHNSFVFKVRLLKFCTEIPSDRMNNLRWKIRIKSTMTSLWRHIFLKWV